MLVLIHARCEKIYQEVQMLESVHDKIEDVQ